MATWGLYQLYKCAIGRHVEINGECVYCRNKEVPWFSAYRLRLLKTGIVTLTPGALGVRCEE